MTLPASPPISFSQIATELGIADTSLNISSANARNLAGVPSGPIGIHDFYGKSATMTANIGGNQSGSGASSSTSFTQSCSVAGGTGPYTYTWSIVSQSAGTVTFGSGSSASTTVNMSVSGGIGSNVTATIECTVHDSASHTAVSNTATLSWTFA